MLWSEICSVVAQVSLTVRSGLGMRRMLDLDFAEHLYYAVGGMSPLRVWLRPKNHRGFIVVCFDKKGRAVGGGAARRCGKWILRDGGRAPHPQNTKKAGSPSKT